MSSRVVPAFPAPVTPPPRFVAHNEGIIPGSARVTVPLETYTPPTPKPDASSGKVPAHVSTQPPTPTASSSKWGTSSSSRGNKGNSEVKLPGYLSNESTSAQRMGLSFVSSKQSQPSTSPSPSNAALGSYVIEDFDDEDEDEDVEEDPSEEDVQEEDIVEKPKAKSKKASPNDKVKLVADVKQFDRFLVNDTPTSLPSEILELAEGGYKIRDIDREHVKRIESAMLHQWRYDRVSTVNVIPQEAWFTKYGNMKKPELQVLMSNKKLCKFIVLDGNHSLKAIRRCEKQYPDQLRFQKVSCNIYWNLNEEDGYNVASEMQNCAENVMKVTERARLFSFRSHWLRFCKEYPSDENKRMDAMRKFVMRIQWRSVNDNGQPRTDREEKKYREARRSRWDPLIQLAVKPARVWNAVTDVFFAADEAKLKAREQGGTPAKKKRSSWELETDSIFSNYSLKAIKPLTTGRITEKQSVRLLKELSKKLEDPSPVHNEAQQLKLQNELMLGYLNKEVYKMTPIELDKLPSWEDFKQNYVPGMLQYDERLLEFAKKLKGRGRAKGVAITEFCDYISRRLDVQADTAEVHRAEWRGHVSKQTVVGADVTLGDVSCIKSDSYDLVHCDQPYSTGRYEWDDKNAWVSIPVPYIDLFMRTDSPV